MEKAILTGIIILVFLPLFSLTVYMNNGLKFEGYYEAKSDGNIYILNGKTVYELPIDEVNKIMNGFYNKTGEHLKRDNFSKIDLSSNDYDIVSYDFINALESKEIEFNQALSNMSDREFAIYELEQRQRQADIAAKKSSEIRDAIYISGGILTAAIIIINIVYYQEL
ncbi:MAG: hypothetical protein K9M99_02825 [Candidatus Cloacimonetes bacterium]|nr:hypothetical protein [Candidatus Cloacimonadota bacterium]